MIEYYNCYNNTISEISLLMGSFASCTKVKLSDDVIIVQEDW